MVFITQKIHFRKLAFFNSIWYFTSNIKPLKTAFLYKAVFCNEEMTEKLMPYEIIL